MSFLSSDDDDCYEEIFTQTQSLSLQLTPVPRMRPPGRIDVVIPPRVPPQFKKHLIVRVDLVDDSTVRFSPFPEAEAVFRRHGGVETFIDSSTFWDIPIRQYRAVKAALECPSNNFIAKLDTIPEPVFKAVIGLKPRPSSPSDLETLPKKLLSGLFPHQRESVLFAVSRGFRVFVADDMGLGKTIEAIAIACAAGFPQRLRVLVVSPNNLTNSWIDAFLEWTNVCRSQINVVLRPESLADTPLTIVSFTTIVRVSDILSGKAFDLTIVDESHELKNPKTQTYKALHPIILKSRYTLLLSGTPTLNRPAELFPQLKLLLPDVFWSFKEFALRYCRGVVDQFGHLQSGGCSHADELKAVLEYLVMIRRQKADVLTDLPVPRQAGLYAVQRTRGYDARDSRAAGLDLGRDGFHEERAADPGDAGVRFDRAGEAVGGAVLAPLFGVPPPVLFRESEMPHLRAPHFDAARDPRLDRGAGHRIPLHYGVDGAARARGAAHAIPERSRMPDCGAQHRSGGNGADTRPGIDRRLR
jgi:hypothetical protein